MKVKLQKGERERENDEDDDMRIMCRKRVQCSSHLQKRDCGKGGGINGRMDNTITEDNGSAL